MEFNDPIAVQDAILSDFIRSCMLSNVLQASSSKVYQQTEILAIPAIHSQDVIIDKRHGRVEINIQDAPGELSSATSITKDMKCLYSTEELRTFIHDFTFMILTQETDQRFDKHFPPERDFFDHRTPDLFIITETATLLLEFSTSRNDHDHYLQKAFDVKEFAYYEAFKRRMESSIKRGETKKYGFSPIIISSTKCMVSTDLHLDSKLVNELCARFRFAVNVMDLLAQLGVKLEETEFDQMKTDLKEQLIAIEPIWQKNVDGAIPLTPERVLTTDVSSSEARAFARLEYIRLLRKNMAEVPRRPNDCRAKEIWDGLVSKNLGARMDRRSILQLPGILPKKSSGVVKIPNQMFACDSLPDLWDEAIDHMRTVEWSYELSLEELKDMALRVGDVTAETEDNKMRRRYKRVKIKLSQEQRIEFAKVGVQGKQLKDDLCVQDYRLRKKEPFSLDATTDDVDDFINDVNLMEDIGPPVAHVARVTYLLDHALNLHEPKIKPGSELLSRIHSDLLFQWTSFISDVGSELCVSLKQNVGHDEFVLKALRNWDAFLLIKPTNSDSHIFYTILMPIEGSLLVLKPGLAKQAHTYGDNYIFPWMSYSVSKLVNCVKTESFFLAMVSQWSRYYEIPSTTGSKNSFVRRMVNLSLLIHLEDKARTEELLTLFRYISMEKFSLRTPNNEKMIDKIPNIVRSRLQIWVIKKLVLAMAAPNYEPTVDEVVEGNLSKKERKWCNMLNPYTGEAIEHPQKLIELYYLGYCTNKDAKSWANTEFELVKKIVQYEIELSNIDPQFCGLKENPTGSYKIHEWSRTMNCAGADAIKRLLTIMYSDNYMDHIENKMLSQLSRLTWEQVATLKASSTFDPHTTKERDCTGKHRTQRVKVLIAVLRNMGELEDTPAKSISRVLNWVDKDGGLRVDIFKKNQHGGLREIYVLELHSRILQLCLEEISRTICSEIPIEMMTHSKNKISKPQEHMFASAIDRNAYKVNVSSSNDAKVWNQGHHVAKFCQFMCRLLPPMWHGLIVNGLRQWTTRKIALPDGVLDLLKQTEIPLLHDPISARIRAAYLGISPAKWLQTGNEYLQIESGMMQGILHYMSSLYHCGLLLLRDSLWKSLIKTKDMTCRTLDLVSSDDSSRMTDVFTDSPKMLKMGKIYARADHLLIKDLSPYFGIHMSPKSTYCSNGVMEFNSEFFFRASLYRPTLKWAYASLNIIEVESLVERQEVMYNLITQLLEAGSGFRQAHETQVAQAFLHYRLLGSSINPLFSEFAIHLLGVQDPALGYFFLDHPLCAGLPGYQFNVWRAINSNRMLSALYANLLEQGDLTTTTSGQIVRSCQVRFGNRQKAIRLIEEAEKVLPVWRDEIESNPAVLYQTARDIKASVLKILVKLTSPSVIRSLAKGNSIARMLASSVYLINGLATTLGSNWNHVLEEKLGRPVHKISLWNLLQQSLHHQRPMSPEEMLILFPLRDYYSSLSNLLTILDGYTLAPGGTRKMLRSHILVYPDPPSLPFSLEEMVRWMWFNEHLPASKTTLTQIWDLYSSTYQWLRSTPEDSLAAAGDHFETHIQMRNFIARQTTKSRSVHLTGAPVRDSGAHDLLYSAITRNQMTLRVLVPSGSLARPELSTGDSTMSAIACLLTFPFKTESKIELVIKQLMESRDIWDGGSTRPSPRKTRLGVIQQYLKKTENGRRCSGVSEIEFNKILKDSRLGIVGGFVRRQKFDESTKHWTGSGKWCGIIGEASVDLYIEGSILKEVITNSIEKLRECQHMLKHLLSEFGVSSFTDNTFYNLSPERVYYDINQLRADRVGAPVREVKSMFNTNKVNLPNLEVVVGDGNIRLMHKLCNGITYTLVAYKCVPADFKFNKPIQSHLRITRGWLNNTPLDHRYAERMLIKGMCADITKNVDPDRFKLFVRETLIPSLSRAGFRFNMHRIGTEASIAKEIDLSAVHLIGEEEDLFDFDDDYSFLEQVEKEVESTEMDLEFEPFDLVMGDVLLTESNRDLIPIHHIHRLWDDYAKHVVATLSQKDLARIESGFLPRTGVCSITRYLSFYAGWSFKAFDEDLLADCEVLETLEEEF
nr:RdRp [Wugcerasp virus 10]